MKILTALVRSSLSDIDAMRVGDQKGVFGPFSSEDGETIEWLNLDITAQSLRHKMSDLEGWEWRGMLTVSTSHMSEKDARILEHIGMHPEHPLANRVCGYEYGFIIRRLSQIASYREFRDMGLSDEALQLITFAMTEGFEVLELDSQGPTIGGLPVFDW